MMNDLKQSDDWISVDYALPDADGFYLVYFCDFSTDKMDMVIKWWDKDIADFTPWEPLDENTHWMPLPKPPEE